jgi:TetR/AcrR family transcriptional regulator
MARGTFERILPEKQQMIFSIAMKEFAKNGYYKANINTIASKAGISIGAMYKYFSSKEELFCDTLEMGIGVLNETFMSRLDRSNDPFEKIKSIFLAALHFSKENPQALQIYMSLLSSSMDSFSKKYAKTIEEVGHTFFKKIIEDGIASGHVHPDVDIDAANYFLDNNLMMFSFSQISLYLKIRLETFLEGRKTPEELIEDTVSICRKIFGAKP